MKYDDKSNELILLTKSEMDIPENEYSLIIIMSEELETYIETNKEILLPSIWGITQFLQI